MKGEILFLGTCWIDGIEDRSNYWIQVDPATVEQFIGLTDKYSKKIFEEDILMSSRWSSRWSRPCHVSFMDGVFTL